MTLANTIKSLKIERDIKKNEFKIYSSGDAKIKVTKNGYIVGAQNLSTIMWCIDPKKLDEEVIGLHVSDFAKELGKYGASHENYDSFCNSILLHYKNTPILKHSCEDIQKPNKQKQLLKKR